MTGSLTPERDGSVMATGLARVFKFASMTALATLFSSMLTTQVYVSTVSPDIPWDHAAYPIGTIQVTRQVNGRMKASCGLNRDWVLSTLGVGSWRKVYFSTTGNDTTGNGTEANPYRTFLKAVQDANASGQDTNIISSSGLYNRGSLPAGLVLAVNIACGAQGGRVEIGTFDTSGIIFAASTTVPGAYCANFSSAVARAFDRSRKNEHDDFVEMTLLSNYAEVGFTANSWNYFSGSASGTTSNGSANVTFASNVKTLGWSNGMGITGTGIQANTTISSISADGLTVTLSANAAAGGTATLTASGLYMRRFDGSQPLIGASTASSNTLALRSVGGMQFQQSTQKSVYFYGLDDRSGWDFYGGTLGALRVSYSAAVLGTRVIVGADNCTGKYAGNATNQVNGLSTSRVNGLSIFTNCTADANTSDGINYHDEGDVAFSANGYYHFDMNCSANDNGRPGAQSCNLVTSHDRCVGVSLCPQGGYNHGVNIHIVGDAKLFVCGAQTRNSKGDKIFGGSIDPCEARADNNSILRLDLCDLSPANDNNFVLFTNGGDIKWSRMVIRGRVFAQSGSITPVEAA